ncbi:MAG: hypothetical protein H6709_17960 [Kofleriaceae bacterium]|nr:hypothetical protein [Kofleriaceae bacterium]
MYRYGDGTPFPFEENFIDTLVAAVDAAVGAFSAAAEIDDRRDKAREARHEAEEELRRFGVMEKAIEAAVFPHRPSADRNATLAQQAAHRALAMSRQAIAAVRAQVEQRLQMLAGEPRTARAIERTRNAMAAFFEGHQLPDTAWRHAWQAEGPVATGEATALAGRFRATFDLELQGPWRAVVRVGALVPGLTATVPRKKLFGGYKPGRIALDRCGLVSVERGPERHVLVVRASATKASAGWRIVLDDPERSGVTVTPVAPGGRAIGHELTLDGPDAEPFRRLGEAVDDALDEARDQRRRLRELMVGDAELEALTDPAVAGRGLMGVLGPLIRQIRARSRVTGELAIKRDIGDGRREELFVPRDAVERRFVTLPTVYRKVFEDLGLGRQSTEDVSPEAVVKIIESVPPDEMATRPEPPRLPEPPRVVEAATVETPEPRTEPRKELRGDARPEPRPGPQVPPPAPLPRLPARAPAAAAAPRPVARGTDSPPVATDEPDVVKPADALSRLPAVPPTLPRVPHARAATN